LAFVQSRFERADTPADPWLGVFVQRGALSSVLKRGGLLSIASGSSGSACGQRLTCRGYAPAGGGIAKNQAEARLVAEEVGFELTRRTTLVGAIRTRHWRSRGRDREQPATRRSGPIASISGSGVRPPSRRDAGLAEDPQRKSSDAQRYTWSRPPTLRTRTRSTLS